MLLVFYNSFLLKFYFENSENNILRGHYSQLKNRQLGLLNYTRFVS